LSLGAVSGATAIRPLHITQLALPRDRQFNPSNPTATLASTADLTLTIIGKGFVSGSRVRLDETQLPAPTNVTDRQMTVTVSGATFLTSARRYAVDVLNPGGTRSNVTDLTVIQPVDVTSTGCTAPAPGAVANSGSSTVSLFSTDTGTTTPAVTTVSVDQRPVAVAIDSIRNLALVANSSGNTLSQIDLSQGAPAVGQRYFCQQNPTGVVFDAASNLFIAACAQGNSLILVDPIAQQSASLRVGINPTSIANNFHSSTLVTVNTGSN